MKRVEYPEDCIRVRNALEQNGYGVTLYEAEQFWRWRSEIYSAGWLDTAGRNLVDEIDSIIAQYNLWSDPDDVFYLPKI